MATAKQIAYSCLSQVYNFNISDDIDIDLEWIYYQLGLVRASILDKEQQQSKFENNYRYFTDINCLKLECVDEAECCDIQTDCNIFKISLGTNILFPELSFVGLVDKKTRFSYLKRDFLNSLKYRRYHTAKGYWYIMNKNIYIVTDMEHLEYISVSVLLEDPLAVKDLMTCKGSCVDFENENYPIDQKRLPMVEEFIVNKMRASLNNVKDLTNNDLDDAMNQVKSDMKILNQLNTLR